MPYLSASAVVIHYKEALYQVYAPYLYLYYVVVPMKNSSHLAKVYL